MLEVFLFHSLTLPYVLPAVWFLWMMTDGRDVELECKHTENINKKNSVSSAATNKRHHGVKEMHHTKNYVLSLVEYTIQIL